MPVADDESIKQAARKKFAQQRRKDGRSSTILSDGMKLGG